METRAEAGRGGKQVRSDCHIGITLQESGGIDIHMKSKVDVLYGRANRALLEEACRVFDIEHARIDVEDSGALPYTMAARFETAVKRLRPQETRAMLLPAREGIYQPTAPDRFRRSRLYLPGNDPKLSINAAIHGADGIILDLEDSVAPSEKDAARILVRNALREIDFLGAERMVRINQGELGKRDLEAIIPERPNLILVPKVEDAQELQDVHAVIAELRNVHQLEEAVYLMPIIESARGGVNAYEIATAADSVVAIAIGLEDYTADLGVARTNEGRESLWLRGAVVNAARAAGVQAIDTVFSDVSDMEGLLESTREAKALGFDGKGCIHPRQIAVVHDGFAPPETEIDRARRIVLAFDAAERQGLGVVSLGSKMIDPPVVKRAQTTITLAIKSGLLSPEWKEENDEE